MPTTTHAPQIVTVSATATNIYPDIFDVDDYGGLIVQASGTFLATLVIETTVEDPVSASTVWSSIGEITRAGRYTFSVLSRYLRVRCSEYTNGTITVAAHFKTGDILPTFSEFPTENSQALSVRSAPIITWRKGFTAAALDQTVDWQLVCKGAGQTIAHTIAAPASNLVIAAGTTANEETIYLSRRFWTDNIELRLHTILSARIADNNFSIALVDIVGNATIATNGTTTVTFTLAKHGLRVGQILRIGNVVMGAGVVPSSAQITVASVADVNTFTATITGTTGTSTGTCLVYGKNEISNIYTSTTATNSAFRTMRDGFGAAAVTATITTTATGHIGIIQRKDEVVTLFNQAPNSTTAATLVANRNMEIPENDIPLYLMIRATNGTTNPAGNTTWTINYVAVRNV